MCFFIICVSVLLILILYVGAPVSIKNCNDETNKVPVIAKTIAPFSLKRYKIQFSTPSQRKRNKACRNKLESVLGYSLARSFCIWSSEEDKDLLKRWLVGTPLLDIAITHQRTVSAISQRLTTLLPFKAIGTEYEAKDPFRPH